MDDWTNTATETAFITIGPDDIIFNFLFYLISITFLYENEKCMDYKNGEEKNPPMLRHQNENTLDDKNEQEKQMVQMYIVHNTAYLFCTAS